MERLIEVRWKNFRGFSDTGWITIKPVTIVLGSNNSGKTSLHAPLLLLKQTSDTLDAHPALLTSGDLIDVGSFNDAVHCHEPDERIEFNLRWDRVWNERRKRGALGSERPGACRWDFVEGDHPRDTHLSRITIQDVYWRSILTRRSGKNGRYSIADLPERLKSTGGVVERAMVKAARDAEPFGFMFMDSDVDDARWRALAERSRHRESSLSDLPGSPALNMYQTIVGYTYKEVDSFLDDIYYIGPIRERLKRFYEVSGARPRSVGTRGQDTPHLIYRWRDEREKMEELDYWLANFGFTQRLMVEEQGPYAFSLALRRAKGAPTIGFVDLGFGVSQVLPLIVQGLNADAGDLVVAEQPEIHLNPALQAELADLFVNFAVEKNLWNYIETHSEHLLLRMRRLVAEKKIPADDVAIYYVERVGQESRVRPILLNDDGSLAPDTWPSDFFGESLRDALALAEAQMRIEEQK